MMERCTSGMPDVTYYFPYMGKDPIARAFCVHCPITNEGAQWHGRSKDEVLKVAAEHLLEVHGIEDPTYA